MNRLLILASVIIALLSSCAKKEFKLEFELPAKTHSNYQAVYYASDQRGGVTVETVAVVSGGKGELKCMAVNPCLVYLFASNQKYPIVIYAEKGDKIDVSGDSADPFTWNVGGNEINAKLTEWRKKNAKTLASADAAKINAAVDKYVVANPSSGVSALLLLTAYSRYEDNAGFRKLWRRLTGEARSPKWTQLVARADIPSGSAAEPALIKRLTLRTFDNGVDTIDTSKARASLFLFFNNGIDNRKAVFDSIRALAKAYPDSSRRIIVDACMDPDSLSWRSPLRSDSMSKTVRAWIPAGMADPALMKMGVRTSPTYIVVSPDGRQRYHGASQEDAIREFRSLMKKEPAKKKADKETSDKKQAGKQSEKKADKKQAAK